MSNIFDCRVNSITPSPSYLFIALKSNYAFKPIAGQSLRPNQTIVPQRLNAALGPSWRLLYAEEVEGRIRAMDASRS